MDQNIISIDIFYVTPMLISLLRYIIYNKQNYFQNSKIILQNCIAYVFLKIIYKMLGILNKFEDSVP